MIVIVICSICSIVELDDSSISAQLGQGVAALNSE
jgi:hypothetical protein